MKIDMSGKIYNSWKVLEPNPARGKNHWLAECLVCSRVFSVDGRNIRSGLSKRCSECGNKNGHSLQKGTVRTKRTPQETAFHYLHIQLRKDAKKRGLEWDLTVEQVTELVLGNCHYSGHEPTSESNPLKHMGLSQRNVEGATIRRNGIDRLDSSKGYFVGNVVSCCKICNLAKRDMSVEEFLSWLDSFATFRGYTKA